jgi:hypothetical protein
MKKINSKIFIALIIFLMMIPCSTVMASNSTVDAEFARFGVPVNKRPVDIPSNAYVYVYKTDTSIGVQWSMTPFEVKFYPNTIFGPIYGLTPTGNDKTTYEHFVTGSQSNGWTYVYTNTDTEYGYRPTDFVNNKLTQMIYTNHSIKYNGTIIAGEEFTTEYEYSNSIPTPSNVRVKMILPSGLFPENRETTVKTTWQPSSDIYRLEISLLYDYKSGSDKITRLLPYITYGNGLMSSIGIHNALMVSELQSFINASNTATSGQTFSNGKLNLTHYYIRYSTIQSGKIKYGNWVKVDLVTGKSVIDKGNVVSQYDEVYEDSSGNEIVVDNSEYGGKMYDNDGNVVNPDNLTSFTDYLMAIPNILSSTFTALTSLISGMGSFGAVISAVFVGMPPIMTSMILGGLGLLIVLGVIKFLK